MQIDAWKAKWIEYCGNPAQKRGTFRGQGNPAAKFGRPLFSGGQSKTLGTFFANSIVQNTFCRAQGLVLHTAEKESGETWRRGKRQKRKVPVSACSVSRHGERNAGRAVRTVWRRSSADEEIHDGTEDKVQK